MFIRPHTGNSINFDKINGNPKVKICIKYSMHITNIYIICKYAGLLCSYVRILL